MYERTLFNNNIISLLSNNFHILNRFDWVGRLNAPDLGSVHVKFTLNNAPSTLNFFHSSFSHFTNFLCYPALTYNLFTNTREKNPIRMWFWAYKIRPFTIFPSVFPSRSYLLNFWRWNCPTTSFPFNNGLPFKLLFLIGIFPILINSTLRPLTWMISRSSKLK